MSTIFISYASEDKAKARQFFEAFEKQGWTVFWDRDISTGKSFHEVIDEELAQAKAVVVLWSGISVKKNWVLEEAQDGLDRKILIPVLIEEVKPPRGFRLIQTASLIGWEGSTNSQAFIRLVQDIVSLIGSSIDIDSVVTNQNAYFQGWKFYNAGNYTEAYPLWLKAANAGDANAQVGLGYMYNMGRGVAQNYEEAVKWYRMAAEQGNADGQCNLGYMYDKGKGVKQNDAEAMKWYRKATEQGHAHGQSNLGSMYRDGQGIAQNYEEAVKWYRMAAEKGDADGQNNLGAMYEFGQGVTRDREEAIKWFRLSAKQGNEDAQENLKRLGETW